MMHHHSRRRLGPAGLLLFFLTAGCGAGAQERGGEDGPPGRLIEQACPSPDLAATTADDQAVGRLVAAGHCHRERGEQDLARGYYQRALEEYARRKIEPGTSAAARAAEAQFFLVEGQLDDWEQLEIPAEIQHQQGALKKIIEGQKALIDGYEAVWRLEDPNWTLASAFRIAHVFERFGTKLRQAPIPFEEGTEEHGIYRDQLLSTAEPLEAEALKRYEKVLEEAERENIETPWVERAREAAAALRERKR